MLEFQLFVFFSHAHFNLRSSIRVYSYKNCDLLPQGSFLSSQLFLVRTIDVKRCCNDCECVRFADVTKFYLSSNNIESLIVNANIYPNKYKQSFEADTLTFNVKQTHYFFFHKKQLDTLQTNLKVKY